MTAFDTIATAAMRKAVGDDPETFRALFDFDQDLLVETLFDTTVRMHGVLAADGEPLTTTPDDVRSWIVAALSGMQ